MAKPRAEECMHRDWLQHFFISKSLLAAQRLNLVFSEPSVFCIAMNYSYGLERLYNYWTIKHPPTHTHTLTLILQNHEASIRSETGRKSAQIVH